MRKLFLLVAGVFLILLTEAQTPNNRFRLNYRLRPETFKYLAEKRVTMRDRADTPITGICAGTKFIKCVITNDKGLLTVDPWRILDTPKEPDTCKGDLNTINSATPYPLKVDIRRGFANPGKAVVGDPTKKLRFHYRAWILGVNTMAIKFRPKVKDFNGIEYSPNTITGTINAGIGVGHTFGWTKFTHRSTNSLSLTPTLSFGFASATLAKEPLKKQVTVSNNPSNFILSPSLGCIIGRNELGILIAYGSDFMFGKNASAWAYQGKGFIGVGLSASFKL